MVSKKLKTALKHLLSKDEIQILIRGYDVLGDVAIIIVPEELVHFEKIIAKTILQALPHIRVVAKRVGNYSGEFRTISLDIIGGQGGLETMHREFGVNLHLNPEKVYFSPRSGSERHRIASLILAGERVLVMFSGIAPLPLMIALHSEASEITGIEKNPVAHHYGLKNLDANPRVKNITLIQGDVCDVVPLLSGDFDRVIMPLPFSAGSYVEIALKVLMKGGWLHFYDFKHFGQFEEAEESVCKLSAQQGRVVSKIDSHRCGHISPGRYRICVDAQIS